MLSMSCTGHTSPCSVKRIAGGRSHFTPRYFSVSVRSTGSDLLRDMHIGTSSVISGQKSRAKACNASLADTMKRVGHSTFVVLSRTQGQAPGYLCGCTSTEPNKRSAQVLSTQKRTTKLSREYQYHVGLLTTMFIAVELGRASRPVSCTVQMMETNLPPHPDQNTIEPATTYRCSTRPWFALREMMTSSFPASTTIYQCAAPTVFCNVGIEGFEHDTASSPSEEIQLPSLLMKIVGTCLCNTRGIHEDLRCSSAT